jgi:hypothetical protein
MPTTGTLQTGHHGPMRQHIVTLDRFAKGRQTSAYIVRDRYLRRLVRSGIATPGQLHDAIASCGTTPSSFTWLTDVNRDRLAKADCVFLAEYGTFPTSDIDFQVNGDYYRICRGLEYDWHYYDKLLERLHWDERGNAYVRPEAKVVALERTERVERTRGNPWAFGLVLVAGLVGGPLATAAILRHVSGDLTAAGSVFGILGLLAFAALLKATLPRRRRQMAVVRWCSRCRRELDPRQAKSGCPGCGAWFAA